MKMADIATSHDSHDTNEREGERPPSLSRVSIVSVSQLEVAPEPEVTGGAGAPELPQGDQSRPCVIDQQQAPQANQAAAAAAESTNQPQTSTSSEMPMTSHLEAPAQAPNLPLEPVSEGEGWLGQRAAGDTWGSNNPGGAAAEARPGSTPTSGRLGSTAAEESQTAAPTPTAPAAAPLVYLQRRTASAWSAEGTRAREARDAAAATYRGQVAAWEAGKLQGGTAALQPRRPHSL